MQQMRITVREIIEYVMRSGDISAVFLSSKRMADGIKAHQKFQKQSKEQYEREVSIDMLVSRDGVEILLSGRIDGVIREEAMTIIDEIKSTARSIDDIDDGKGLHWAQVMMYAYMYCIKYGLDAIKTRLTYIELDTFKIKQFVQEKDVFELEEFFYDVIDRYIEWAKAQKDFKVVCLESIKNLEFPFEGYRKGQKQLMAAVYKSIEEGKLLFSRAPTGIGKTIATLFPAIKAYGNDKCEKIFYLTAKNIGKQVALDTLLLLESKGLSIKRVVITAKDKACLMEERNCDPEYCHYAKGHYDRVNAVLSELYQNYNHFDRELIEKYAILHQVCPYELSLDIATFCEIVICDYNYVFDPTASLKRFFSEEGGKYSVLIDEAHNLVDRAREMFSASLDKKTVLDLKKKVKQLDQRLYQYFTKLNKLFIEKKKVSQQHRDGAFVESDMPHEFEDLVKSILYRTEKIFKIHKDWPYMPHLLEFYFNGFDFVKKMELYDDRYVTYYQKDGDNFIVKMFCIDPSNNLRSVVSNLQGVVYFSATLIPMHYYVSLLGGDENSYGLNLASPFEQKRLCLLIDRNITTKYDLRDKSVVPIIESIDKITDAKKGNYMVFFPSYKYMEKVYEAYFECYDKQTKELIIQERYLNDVQREMFLEQFSEKRDKTLIAFVVLGGMFGEGIDLTGDKLVGAIIVSVGIPQIGYERDLIKGYFDKTLGNGYEYAYTFPGMNKVMQSAGRVIRTNSDSGVVALLDQRFNTPYYKSLFPVEWSHSKTVHTVSEMQEVLENFWETLEN